MKKYTLARASVGEFWLVYRYCSIFSIFLNQAIKNRVRFRTKLNITTKPIATAMGYFYLLKVINFA
ncbi:hypothetical protein BOQ64_15195 [Chryseobacterium sp. CH25]|nr:hypothetical protein BOQ64_15195 [Chryseobacterium sp. CH25]